MDTRSGLIAWLEAVEAAKLCEYFVPLNNDLSLKHPLDIDKLSPLARERYERAEAKRERKAQRLQEYTRREQAIVDRIMGALPESREPRPLITDIAPGDVLAAIKENRP